MYKLLIADDEDEIRNGLYNYFPWHEAGFEAVGLVENGEKVLEFIQYPHVDALLSDIRMPELGGIELARELHEQKSKMRIVFLSGYRDFEYAQKAIIYGVKDYIIKPTKYEELIDTFHRVKEELDNENAIQPEKLPAQKPDSNCTNNIIETIKAYIDKRYFDATLEDVSGLVRRRIYRVCFNNSRGAAGRNKI